MAEAGGGTNFRVRTMEDLVAMAASLDALEPNASSRPPMRYRQSLWPWPAALALVLLAGHALSRHG